jgi:hypothetical protein
MAELSCRSPRRYSSCSSWSANCRSNHPPGFILTGGEASGDKAVPDLLAIPAGKPRSLLFSRLKQFRAIATRYDKKERSFAAFLAPAAARVCCHHSRDSLEQRMPVITGLVSDRWIRSVFELKKPSVSSADTILKRNARFPAHVLQLLIAHQLSRRAIGLGKIMNDLTFVTDNAAYQTRQFDNFEICTRADIDVLRARIGFEEKHQRVGAIVDVKEFSARGSCAPDHHMRVIAKFRGMRLADERRQHMTGTQVEIIAWAV